MSVEHRIIQRSLVHIVTFAAFIATTTTGAARAGASPITIQPSSLAPGSTYYLVFVTADLYAGTSASIATYNTDVNTEANANAALASLGTTWTAIASTGATAQSNINGGAAFTAAVYNLAGLLVATGETGLFSGTLTNPIDIDEAGNTRTDLGGVHPDGSVTDGDYVFTGIDADGTSDGPLGTNGKMIGFSGATDQSWASDGFQINGDAYLYAISGALTVPSTDAGPGNGSGTAAVPEPGSIALLVTGLGVVGRKMLRRRL